MFEYVEVRQVVLKGLYAFYNVMEFSNIFFKNHPLYLTIHAVVTKWIVQKKLQHVTSSIEPLYCGHLGDLVKCPIKRSVLISVVKLRLIWDI